MYPLDFFQYGGQNNIRLFAHLAKLFAELKAFIRRNWHSYEDNPDQGFDTFLEWCVDIVGARDKSAEGHFRHAGLTIDEM